MTCTRWIQIAAFSGLIVPCGLMAQDVSNASETVVADNCKSVDLRLDFSAGVIDIQPVDITDLLKLDVYYTPRTVRYSVDKTERAGVCEVYLESDQRRNWSDDESENEWTLQLSRKYPMAIEMEIGASEARMDLGGIPLTALIMDVGAAEMELDFSQPNPTQMKTFTVDCGASSMEITGLAAANARFMSFDVGAGSCEIDLRGDIKGEVELDINVGVGSVDVILSQDVAVSVDGDDEWFSTIDFRGLDLRKTRRGVWETDDFDRATDRVVITADVAMGSISISAKR